MFTSSNYLSRSVTALLVAVALAGASGVRAAALRPAVTRLAIAVVARGVLV
jgi:hypothetical protein